MSFYVLWGFLFPTILFLCNGYKYFPEVFEDGVSSFCFEDIISVFSLTSFLIISAASVVVPVYSHVRMRRWEGWVGTLGSEGLVDRCLFRDSRRESGHPALDRLTPVCGMLSTATLILAEQKSAYSVILEEEFLLLLLLFFFLWLFSSQVDPCF